MKIYTNEEMELINNVFDLISLKFNSKEFSDLVKEIKELINVNQKYAREIERLKSNEKTLAELLDKEQNKNKKAIEYLDNLRYTFSPKELKDILKGE